ncbi:TetR family transcriptional regulator C-terminal domain-containing protein [Streptomyces griseorubiginosus]|uniref:TetR/AcrR family transcriptional regulator n=1 Tax=Streptomyces griseorubiginosus TaxID=67304 RepID=UPI0036E48587
MPKIVDHEARRADLARALWSVVQRDGVNAASIRAVAAEAGWTYGSVAHYFKTRDEMLLFAYRLAFSREREHFPVGNDQLNALDRLVGVLLRALPVDEASTIDFQIWLAFMGRVADDPSLAESVRQEHDLFHDDVRVLVGEAVVAGFLGPEHGVPALVETVVTFVNGLGVVAALDPRHHGPEQLERKLRDFLSKFTPTGGGATEAHREAG